MWIRRCRRSCIRFWGASFVTLSGRRRVSGYRGHDYEGRCAVHVDLIRRGKIAKSLWRWMKRRAAIEAEIGHLKHGHRMDRNRLKGAEGDMFNAILSATGMNMSKLVKRLVDLLRLVYIWVYKRIFRILSLNLKLDQVNSLT